MLFFLKILKKCAKINDIINSELGKTDPHTRQKKNAPLSKRKLTYLKNFIEKKYQFILLADFGSEKKTGRLGQYYLARANLAFIEQEGEILNLS